MQNLFRQNLNIGLRCSVVSIESAHATLNLEINALLKEIDAIGDMDAVFHPLPEGQGDADNPREVTQIINFTS